jgi:imidazole glycerol-phosphate synthase subunit HisH
VTAPRVAVIDYGIGNLRSAEKALQRAGADAFLTTDPADIGAADAVVLPGVGAMGRCMDALAASGLRQPTLDAIQSGRPFLGVCVGMQMLHSGSTEHGGVEGLGVFAATVRLIQPGCEPTSDPGSQSGSQPGSQSGSQHAQRLKVPHMQWNRLVSTAPSRLVDGAHISGEKWVYFVHSFAAEAHPAVVAIAEYGGSVTAVVEHGNVMGTQFHPEKSGRHGLALLTSFVDLSRNSSGPGEHNAR